MREFGPTDQNRELVLVRERKDNDTGPTSCHSKVALRETLFSITPSVCTICCSVRENAKEIWADRVSRKFWKGERLNGNTEGQASDNTDEDGKRGTAGTGLLGHCDLEAVRAVGNKEASGNGNVGGRLEEDAVDVVKAGFGITICGQNHSPLVQNLAAPFPQKLAGTPDTRTLQ